MVRREAGTRNRNGNERTLSRKRLRDVDYGGRQECWLVLVPKQSRLQPSSLVASPGLLTDSPGGIKTVISYETRWTGFRR